MNLSHIKTIPYCTNPHPYTFPQLEFDPYISPTGTGTYFPFIMKLKEYAYFFWNVSSFEFKGTINVSIPYLAPVEPSENFAGLPGQDGFNGLFSFEEILFRKDTQKSLVCSGESPFEFLNNSLVFFFNGTATYGVGEIGETETVSANFECSINFDPTGGSNAFQFETVNTPLGRASKEDVNVGFFLDIRLVSSFTIDNVVSSREDRFVSAFQPLMPPSIGGESTFSIDVVYGNKNFGTFLYWTGYPRGVDPLVEPIFPIQAYSGPISFTDCTIKPNTFWDYD
jgi:hypothetical protein